MSPCQKPRHSNETEKEGDGANGARARRGERGRETENESFAACKRCTRAERGMDDGTRESSAKMRGDFALHASSDTGRAYFRTDHVVNAFPTPPSYPLHFSAFPRSPVAQQS